MYYILYNMLFVFLLVLLLLLFHTLKHPTVFIKKSSQQCYQISHVISAVKSCYTDSEFIRFPDTITLLIWIRFFFETEFLHKLKAVLFNNSRGEMYMVHCKMSGIRFCFNLYMLRPASKNRIFQQNIPQKILRNSKAVQI